MSPPGRMYQDCSFEVVELAGATIERLGYIQFDPKPDHYADILLIKPRNGAWNRAFLDVGAAFWEDWGDIGTIPSESIEDDCRFVDCTSDYAGLEIKRIRAQPKTDFTSSIIVELDRSITIELAYEDLNDADSSQVIFLAKQRTSGE